MTEVIFFDAEYARLSPDGTDIIALALIKQSGEELYLELEHNHECSEWVQENVLPHLQGDKVSVESARAQIREFVGDDKPVLVAYVNMFDWMGILKLFGAQKAQSVSSEIPFHWRPIDLASILFVKGVDTEELERIAAELGMDVSGVQPHNALDDARMVKFVYEKVMQ